MINNLMVKNFKSIGDDGIKVELKPLTIFLGPNGSGKSSILEAIGVLSQSIERMNFQTTGRLVNIPLVNNIFYKRSSENWLTFEIEIQATDVEINKLIELSNNKLSDNIQIALQKGAIGYKLSHKWKSNEFSQSILIGDYEIAKTEYINISETSWATKLIFSNSNKTFIPQHSANVILSERAFTPSEQIEESRPFSDIAKEIVIIIKDRILNRVFLISAVRGRTEFGTRIDSSLNKESIKSLGVGTNGQYLIPILSLIYSNREYEETYKKIDKWASKFGLSKFSAGWKGGEILGSDYIDDVLNAVLDLALSSHGSKQILSVITQLFCSDHGAIVMIEEPEISLHPNAQAHLAELFAEAIQEGKKIMIATHSEFLPLTLNIPIQKGLLKREDIAVYHVEKGEKGSNIQKLELTPKGYVKNWVPSFAELEEQLLKEWLEKVPEV